MKKNINKLLATTIAAGFLMLASQSAHAGIFDRDDFSAKELATVKVSLTEAITKAQAKQAGTPFKAQLETENGKMVYDVEFLDRGKEIEMIVDAITGDVTNGDDD